MPGQSPPIALEAPSRSGELVLADGRQLGWSEWGPDSGRPVLLCPGAATSRSLGMASGVVAAHGVRLISADRPGLGASSPAPRRTLNDWPGDVRQLLAAREAAGAPVIGVSQGAPFALACAAAGTVGAAAIVSGSDEIAHPAFADRLPVPLRAMVATAADDPEALSTELAAMTADRMGEMLIEMSDPVDQAVYGQRTFAGPLREALVAVFAQGGEGYARDTLLAMRRWPFDPAEIDVPVHLWYGALDTSPVHSPDHGALLATRLPNARRQVVDRAGGALLWTHGDRVLRDLLEAS